MKSSAYGRLLACLVLAFAPTPARPFDQPNVNLGATSFLDGTPAPAGPGWYFLDYLQYYKAGRLNDADGNRLALPQQDVKVVANVFQLVYESQQKFLGGRLGLDLLLPYVLDANVNDGLNNAVLKAGEGVGDLTVGPFIQFDPAMGPQGPRFAHRLELAFILPSGKYNRNNAINPGSNFWSFNPYWAGTFWFTPEWTASWRAHYLWNAENKEPNVAFGPGATTTQAGETVHVNFAAAYAVKPFLRLGVNGYWLRQLEDTKANGTGVPGTRERVWAVGPGAMLSLSRENHLFFNAYFEQDARNRSEGKRFQIYWAHAL